MRAWMVMLWLAASAGLVGAADASDGNVRPAADHANAGEARPAAGATPRRLSWDVQIGVAPPQSKALVVLLPDASGKQSALIVTAPQGEVVLDRPYAKADIGGKGDIAVGEISPEEVRRRFGATLAAQPPRPMAWVVYFTAGHNKLTRASAAVLEKAKTQLKAELAQRATAEIIVVGHTDQVGTLAANDALSLKRAQFVSRALIAVGIDPRQIEVSGRGAREPLVAAADQRAQPKNRRVEIVIR